MSDVYDVKDRAGSILASIQAPNIWEVGAAFNATQKEIHGADHQTFFVDSADEAAVIELWESHPKDGVTITKVGK